MAGAGDEKNDHFLHEIRENTENECFLTGLITLNDVKNEAFLVEQIAKNAKDSNTSSMLSYCSKVVISRDLSADVGVAYILFHYLCTATLPL